MQFDSALLNNILWIGSLFIVNLFVTCSSMPLTGLFFKNLSDKGFSIASVIGWFGMSYIAFTLMTIKILPVTSLGIAVVAFIWLAINVYIQYKFKTVDLTNVKYKQIGKISTLFIVLFLFMYYVKAHQAEIYQIERFMDYGFIKALFNTDTLPLQDIWFSGEALNYYYFSHFVGFIILSLSHIPTEPGFYILTAWIFAIVGINMFRLGKDVGLSLSINNKTFALISGLISLFWGVFGGVLHSVYWVYKTFEENTNQLLYGWYAEPTRVIAGTITEIPIYSYLVAELHAHMWGMVVALLVISFLIDFWISKKNIITVFMKEYWLLAAALGIAFMVNSWDVVTLGVLSGFILLSKYAISKGQKELKKFNFINFLKAIVSNYNEFTLLIISLVLLPIFAVGIAMPWKYFFEAPVSGVGVVKNISNFTQWFSFWGQFVIIFFLFFYTVAIANTKEFFKNFWKNLINANPGVSFIVLVFLMVVLFWIVMEIIYVKDILLEGEWYRANTFFKITAQLWMWLATITGPMIVFVLVRTKGKIVPKFSFVTIWLIFSICSIYPVKAVWQAALENRAYRGIETGLDFWKNKYPFDYEAYQFLEKKRESLPEAEKMKVIIEAEGDSYADNNYFSVFLGWPTIVGWPVHEWTWRGSYDAVGARRAEVVEVYTGSEMEKAKQILDKYKVDYIILGQIEKIKYPDRINYIKLQALGTVIFENAETQIIEVKH